MQSPLKLKSPIKRPGIPRVDWGNPLAVGLIGCYTPISGFSTVKNLAWQGADLTPLSGAVFVNTPEGPGMQSHVASSYASGAAPPNFQFGNTCSLFWRGSVDIDNTGNADLIQCSFTTTDTTPFDAYTMFRASSVPAEIQIAVDLGGNFNSALDGSAVDTAHYGKFYSFGASIDGVAGAETLYINGVSGATLAIAGNFTYGTPQITLGGYFPIPANISGVTHTFAAIWNRSLSAAEQAAMAADPYGLLWFPDDDIWEMIGGGAQQIQVSIAGFSLATGEGSVGKEDAVSLPGKSSASGQGTVGISGPVFPIMGPPPIAGTKLTMRQGQLWAVPGPSTQAWTPVHDSGSLT